MSSMHICEPALFPLLQQERSSSPTQRCYCPDQVQSISRSQLYFLMLALRAEICSELTPSQPSSSPSMQRCGQQRSRFSTADIDSSQLLSITSSVRCLRPPLINIEYTYLDQKINNQQLLVPDQNRGYDVIIEPGCGSELNRGEEFCMSQEEFNNIWRTFRHAHQRLEFSQ